jgi:DNA-binding phage protein
MTSKINVSGLVPHGGMKKIAEKLGITSQAVSLALKAGKPSHPAVQEVLRMAKESGAIEAAQILATLPQAA